MWSDSRASGARLAKQWHGCQHQYQQSQCSGYDRDDAPIDADSTWAQKGSIAPGAVDVSRRDQIMDLMGIKRQLMFPTGVGMYGTMLAGSLEYDYGLSPSISENRKEYGRDLIKAYNRWGMRVAGISARVRPALPVVADTVADLMQTVRELANNGIRAIWLPSGLPPGGQSPAHDDLEPFWQLMEAKQIAVCLHGNAETVYRSDEWRKARAFEGFRIFEEIRVDPWSIANTHITSQNFLGTMVLGGVFDRHPDLRFGVIELNGAWLGPLCDLLDMWYDTDPLGMKLGTEKSYRPQDVRPNTSSATSGCPVSTSSPSTNMSLNMASRTFSVSRAIIRTWRAAGIRSANGINVSRRLARMSSRSSSSQTDDGCCPIDGVMMRRGRP
jgi:hypothetical protein